MLCNRVLCIPTIWQRSFEFGIQSEGDARTQRCLTQDSFLPFPAVMKKTKRIVPPIELWLD